MTIRLAQSADGETVFRVLEAAIAAAYPRYYPCGAVAWFLSPANRAYIAGDIASGRVYVLATDAGVAGTVTVDGDRLKRLFVLPAEQGKGYGSALAAFAEKKIFAGFGRVLVDAALSARKFYEKRGYKLVSAQELTAENGDAICWNIMEKRK